MQVINLDSAFTPYGQSLHFESFTFNGGEPHFRLNEQISTEDFVTISTRVKNMNDFMALVLALDAIKRIYDEAGSNGKMKLLLPYFPGARQDRICNPGEAFTLEVFANIINSFELAEVIIFDPHSPIVFQKVNNVSVITANEFIQNCLSNLPTDIALVAPDKGAEKRVHNMAKEIGVPTVIQALKRRNLKTGRIEKLEIVSDNLQGRDCLVVDDICDGGATFLHLAKALKLKNAGKLYLAVSHGIFSKGMDELMQHYEQIFTTDSFPIINHTKQEHHKLTRLFINKDF